MADVPTAARSSFIVERVKRRAGAPPLRPLQRPAAEPATHASQLAAELEAFASRLRQIRAIGNNGDATPFYEDRSQAARDASDFASWVRKGAPPTGFVPAERREPDRMRTRYGERH